MLAAAGFTVLAFVTLEIAQGALDRVQADLAAVPAILEAYAITGSADMICKVAATSHARRSRRPPGRRAMSSMQSTRSGERRCASFASTAA